MSANEVVSPIHARMPCLLAEGDFAEWLNPSATAAALHALMVPFAGAMDAVPVGPEFARGG